MSSPPQSPGAPRIKELFAEAIGKDAQERATLLDARCGDDRDLRGAVEALILAYERAEGFMDSPTSAPTTVPDSLPAPRQIGPYKILQEIGEGGFGTVYLAEQETPVRRRVALKLIKAGMDTRQVIARFEAERQALAMMDHPNIARVLDAGATDGGLPFFVMELVNGVPVTLYSDRQRLSIEGRLSLFMQICLAVQHAHQKGIIHRDIKPSNVLVSEHDGRPLVKVIDFGIAKATQSRLTEKTMFTENRQMVGTPEYMSPEQADMTGIDVDTRSDVYSLGVLLYELLTGVTPFDGRELRSKAYAEVQRIIREVDPPKPSTRLSGLQSAGSVAATRATEPARLQRTVRGELDWIAMKCLEKDRSRRYDSASSLAMDVQHYLASEPVSAGPASALYRLRKLAIRRRGPVAAGALVFVVLVAGVIGTTAGMIGHSRQRAVAEANRAEAMRHEAEARTQAAISDAVSQFQQDMLSSADPEKLLGDKVSVFQVIMAAAAELNRGKLADQPEVEAAVRATIGGTLRALGRFDEAEKNLRKAIDLWRKHPSPTTGDRPLMLALTQLGLTLFDQGRFVEAEPIYLESLSISRRILPPNHPDLATDLNNLAMMYYARERYADAEPLFREAIAIYRSTLPADDPLIANALSNLALLLERQNNRVDAESLFREALTISLKSLPPRHPEIAVKEMNLAWLLCDEGQLVEAEPLCRAALDIFSGAFPENHPNIAKCLMTLGSLLQRQNKFAEAESAFRRAMEIHRVALAPDHPDLATSIHNLAQLLWQEKKLPEAEQYFREATSLYRKSLPPGDANLRGTMINLAWVLRDQGKLAEAEPLLREAIGSAPAGVSDEGTRKGRVILGLTLVGLKRYAEAETELMGVETELSKSPDVDRVRYNLSVKILGDLYDHWDEAEPGKGYAAKAAEWKARRPAPATTQGS